MTPEPNAELRRPVVEAEIERLIEILDTLDPEPDLEDTADDEPWLGAPDARPGSWSGLYPEGNDDRELEDCDDEDGGDDEPSLGATNAMVNAWETRLVSREEDREEECEDEGAQCDDEGAYNDDLEPEDECSSCYVGPCNAIGTILGKESKL